MALKKREAPAGAPEWVLTYGDLMSLLLVFFVLIVSMSVPKSDEQLSRAIQAIRQAFGFEGNIGTVPVSDQSTRSLLQQLLEISRQSDESVQPVDAFDTNETHHEGIDGRSFKVTDVREGIEVVVGGGVAFDRFSPDVKPEAQALVASLAEKIAGHNTIVRIKGHATTEPLPDGAKYADPLDLSFARARAVYDILVAHGVSPRRLRLTAVGGEEPLVRQAYDDRSRALNRRVEIVVTEILVDEYHGRRLSDVPE